MKPLVTVIGIAYNQAPYIQEALESLWAQTYDNLQVILLDDASSDGSAELIKKAITDKAEAKLIAHPQNMGYTATFNEGLKLAQGKYIIDFALDDVMLPEFIEKSVTQLEKLPADYGICHCNAEYIDATSKTIDNHKQWLIKGGFIEKMPQGDVFHHVLERYFICTPTMVMKKSVLDKLGGYDPDLAYEDFDLWVRSSRYFQYHYLDEVLMKKRKLSNSLSSQRLKHRENEQLASSLKVCEKAFSLCKLRSDFKSLHKRLIFEIRQCLKVGAYELAKSHWQLLQKSNGALTHRFLYGLLVHLKLPASLIGRFKKWA